MRSTLSNSRALHDTEPGTRTTLLTTDGGLTPEWRKEVERRLPDGMELQTLPAFGRGAFSFSVPLWRWLWKHVAGYDLVVVRALFHPISSVAAWTARVRDVPYVVVPHGTLSRYTFRHRRSLMKKIYFALVERHTLAGAAALRFTSETEREQAPRPCGQVRSSVIPHPFESRFDGLPLGTSTEPIVLFLSRLHPKKGLDVLLPAFRRVREEVPESRLVLAGSGSARYERRLRESIAQRGLQDGVGLPGFVEGDEKRALLRRARVFVLPSEHENFGIAAVEAMDAGLPVVLSRGVDIWRDVDEAGAGIIVDRDPEALARAITKLLSDRDLRHEMGVAGRLFVRSRYDPSRVGPELASLYGQAARTDSRMQSFA